MHTPVLFKSVVMMQASQKFPQLFVKLDELDLIFLWGCWQHRRGLRTYWMRALHKPLHRWDQFRRRLALVGRKKMRSLSSISCMQSGGRVSLIPALHHVQNPRDVVHKYEEHNHTSKRLYMTNFYGYDMVNSVFNINTNNANYNTIWKH